MLERISQADFLRMFKRRFLANGPGTAALAYWKMKYLILTGEAYRVPGHDAFYLVRDRHLLAYLSGDNELHLKPGELNALDAVTLPAGLFETVKGDLRGFRPGYAWSLRYDFNYKPAPPSGDFEAIGFDFHNHRHYKKAAEIINGTEKWLNDKNIKKMTGYAAFDPSLWFFAKEKKAKDFEAVCISAYDPEVRQTDMDWVFVAPNAQGKGLGRFLAEETIRRCGEKSDSVCVGGAEDFYRKCGFYGYEEWVWAAKDGYKFNAPGIQP